MVIDKVASKIINCKSNGHVRLCFTAVYMYGLVLAPVYLYYVRTCSLGHCTKSCRKVVCFILLLGSNFKKTKDCALV